MREHVSRTSRLDNDNNNNNSFIYSWLFVLVYTLYATNKNQLSNYKV